MRFFYDENNVMNYSSTESVYFQLDIQNQR